MKTRQPKNNSFMFKGAGSWLLLICLANVALAQNLPVWQATLGNAKIADWLLKPITTKAEVYQSADKKDIILYNGLLRRSFRLAPNVGCYDFVNLQNKQQLVRSVKAEARLSINGKDYNIGGLYGQKENAYLLPNWLNDFTANSQDFSLEKYEVSPIAPIINWKSAGWWASNKKQVAGKTITFYYHAAATQLAGIRVGVHYSIYDGIPLISKWLTVENNSASAITIGRVVNEIMGMVEEESAVIGSTTEMPAPRSLYLESNYAFNNAMRYDLSDQTTHWKADSTYTSQVNYN